MKKITLGIALTIVLGIGYGIFILQKKAEKTDSFIVQESLQPHWQKILEKAKGQTVYFHAWGGSASINSYIAWAGKKVQQKYGVMVKHVKITDTATSVRRILAEKKSGVSKRGSIDVIWVNGENFKTLKTHNLLSEPFVSDLPNKVYLDYDNKPLEVDFSVPTEGKEAPWGAAQLTFYYNSNSISSPPMSIKELVTWAKENKRRFTYPAPPNFHGTTFLKQILLELNPNSIDVFSQDASMFDSTPYTQKVWDTLDTLHPYLWRKGTTFPTNTAEMARLFDEGETQLGFTFNPYEPENLVRKGNFPASTRAYIFDKGTLGNIHFLALSFNTNSKEGAKVFINFLLSPEAQAHKADTMVWGDPTVLDIKKLGSKKAMFENIKYSVVSPKNLKATLAEPHPSWVKILEKEWEKRYKYKAQ